MSRSRKKTPITGRTSAKSEKQNKKEANKKLRRVTKSHLKQDQVNMPNIKEVSNNWGFEKDGKVFLINPSDKDIRK